MIANGSLTIALALLAAMLVGVGPAAGLDKERPMVCAMGEAFECERGKACERTELTDIGAPRFFRIDLVGQMAQGIGTGARDRKSPIRSIDSIGPLLVMQGMDEPVEGQRGAIGWTASVSTRDGGMVLTAAAEGGAFLLFGDCLLEE
jgi:hypothetical protein